MELLRVDKKGFEEWIKNGNQEMCVVGGGLDRAYFRHSLSNGLDILYMYRYIRDGKLPLNREPEYQGLYKRDTKELYDVGYDLHDVIKDLDIVAHGSANIQEEIEAMVRRFVEEKVATYIAGIKDTAYTEEERKSFREDAWEKAKKKYLNDEEAGEDYECGFHEEHYIEHLMDFITDKVKTAKVIAEEHHEKHRERIPEKVVTQRYVREELAKFNNGEYENYTAMKQIIRSIPEKSQTVNVTICKEGKEMTFKYEARYLRYDCGRCYSTWNMPTSSRWQFDDLYGKDAEIYPTDITRITYGRKVIYEKE